MTFTEFDHFRHFQHFSPVYLEDVILIGKRALKKPTGWERVDPQVLRRCQLRIYAALSAAVCATQTKHETGMDWVAYGIHIELEISGL